MATVKKKMQAGGVSKKSPKAGLVDPNGAWTKVQERTLGNMKKGGKVKKASLGDLFGGNKNKTKIKIKIKSKGKSQDSDNEKSGLSSFLDDLLPGSDYKNGGKVSKAKDGKWIQKAVNPAHKGYCTPMTKATCTPKRKALAKTFKKMAKARK